ncbi:MAG TPA: GGDEF domain-containing protein [Patescibacteria group bacterium]|nr:GGDEF domain-containing protein [Patescibacteria group bacterium]
MTAQRVLILASDARRMEEMVQVPSMKGVHFSILSDWKSGEDALRKENFSVIVARKFSKAQGTDAFVADLLALAPKTSMIHILGEKEGPSVLEALKGGVSEILFEESLAQTLVPCVEKYLFSGYGLLRRMSLDELFDFCIPVITSTDMGLLATTILEKFREALGASFGILFRGGEKGGGPNAMLASLGFPDDIIPAGFLRRFGEALATPGPGPTVTHADTLNAYALGGSDFLSGNRVLLSVPFDLAVGSRVYAVLGLRGTPDAEVLNSPLLNFFQRQARLALINAERSAQAQSLIYIDDLTKLYNGRYLNVVLDREMKRSERYRNFFCVLFMDIDFFKRVNDAHGHLIGSRVLVEVGTVLRACVRDSDTVVRYGGDEFVVLLVETNADEAMIVAERMRKMIEAEPFAKETGIAIRLTISIGIAAFPQHATTKQNLLNLADQAMYRGKESTRNVVYLAHAQNVP